MEVPLRSPEQVRFGPFEIRLSTQEMFKHGLRVKLPPQAFQVLYLLLERQGQLVTREELHRVLWPADTFVDFDHGLNNAIRRIRDVLNDSAEVPRYIETLPRLGYRFVAQPVGGDGLVLAPKQTAAPAQDSFIPAEVVPPAAVPARTVDRRPAVVAVVALLLIAGVGLAVSSGRLRIFAGNRIGPIHSLAVLPLANFSGDPSQEYFADGMTDELITAIAKNRSLRVVSRTSAMQYKGARRPLGQIAQELGVEGILEGSVIRSPGKVHMTLQLIYAPTDTHIWAESYDQEAGGAAFLPEEVAQAVFKELKIAPAAAPPARYVSPEAHDAFLQGRYDWFSGNLHSAEYFRKAITLQPDYAAAWSGLAGAYGSAAVSGELSPQQAWPQAEAATARALALDDRLADAHNAMAAILLFYHWDFVRADQESARAIELDPNFAEAYHVRCYLLNALNRTDEALQMQKKAAELDPFARSWALGMELWRLRRFDDAIEDARRRLAAKPEDASAHYLLSSVFGLRGRQKESVEELELGAKVEGNQAHAQAVKQAYANGGYRAVQELEIRDLMKKATREYVPQISFAYAYARMGMKEETIRYLQLAYEEHSPRLIHMQYEPDFDFLHSDPRYRVIVRDVGLPPAY